MATSLPSLEDRLADAKEAYHSLMTGTMARVIVDQDGQRTEFTAANATKLYGYIQALEAQVTPPDLTTNPGGPIGFVF